MKAGGIAVGTMPLLRAKELAAIIGKARSACAVRCRWPTSWTLAAPRTRC
jgi:hypothetical protein